MNRLLIAIIDLKNQAKNPDLLIEELKKEALIAAEADIIFISPESISPAHLQVPPQAATGFCYKLSYKYAIEQNYQYVVTVEQSSAGWLLTCLPALLEKIQTEHPNVVLASRKGHETAVAFQKKYLKKAINDFYTPACLLSVRWLQTIPFIYNSEKQFQEEFKIQVLLSETRVSLVETGGNEEQPVANFPASVRKLFRQARLHTWGIFYRRNFDCVIDNRHYDLKLGYTSSHTLTIDAIAPDKKVVDIGAGPYSIAPYLMQKNCQVTTVDMFDIPDEFKITEHIIADLNKNFSLPLEKYDYILFLDIIEHLYSPEEFLQKVAGQFGYKSQKVILTTGNIAFFPLRMMLMLGFFNYGKSGILDKTHTRLFTFSTFRKLLEDSNLRITKTEGIPVPFPKAIGNNRFAALLLWLNKLLIKISKTTFAYQIYIEAETTTSFAYLIKKHTERFENNYAAK